VIRELRGTRKHYSLDNICAAFGYTRQAWYNHLKRSELQFFQEHLVLQKIKEIRRDLPKTGCIKLYKELNKGFLQALGISMGRDAVFDLVRQNGMLVKSKKRHVYTTNSFHRYKIHPDLVQRRPANRVEEIWVSDITYISTVTGFTYLSLVTDAYSRKIVGHYLSTNLKAAGCIKALNHAVANRLYPKECLIHHSDRGTQYCCDDYVSILRQKEIQISMTQTGSPYDNAIAERVNGILKAEFELYKIFKSYKQASEAVEQAIYKYNNLRLHASCNYQTPEITHRKQYLIKNTVNLPTVNKYQEENLVL
jgi:transposase InsO family protein